VTILSYVVLKESTVKRSLNIHIRPFDMFDILLYIETLAKFPAATAYYDILDHYPLKLLTHTLP
jgi:hypothetical protein